MTTATATALPPQTLYGADEHGLICAYLFLADQPAQPIASASDALPLLAAVPEGGFIWLHLNLSHAGALPWMQAHAGLSEAFFEALDDGSRSTRIERDEDGLFAVINDLTFDFSFDASDVATLWLGVRRQVVVSARRHPLRTIDRLRMAVKRGEPLNSSVALLDHLMRDQADELQRIVRRVTERLDDIEDALLAGQHERHTAELGRLRRLTVRLQRLLAPEPSALQRTLANPPRWVLPHDMDHLNRASEEFSLVLRDITTMQERIKLMQDEAAARVAEDNNRTLFMLTMVTVLALPINLISGLFGMNVGGIPLNENKGGFWVVLAIIATLTVVLAVVTLLRLRTRRR